MTRRPDLPCERGTALAVAGLLLLAGTLGVSAALAPDIGTESDADGSRVTLVGIHGGGPAWHLYGSVYRLDGRNVTWRLGNADSYFDVTKVPDGRILAGFMDGGYASCGPYEPPCARTGFRIIVPQPRPRVVSEYSFPVRSMSASEAHDVEPLPTGGHLLSDMEHERIVAVRNGTVTWQWNASSFYDAPPDPTTTDWLHINDVDVIEEGRYLVSVRNANQLVVVERGRGVVSVVNRDVTDANDGSCRAETALADYDGDGDVRCGDPTVLDHQHNPQWLGNGSVLVADSGNDRVVELHRTDGGRWRPAWGIDRAGGVALNWPRDADRLPSGHTLVTDTLNRRIVEVNEVGAVVWSVRTDLLPYEADRVPVGEPVGGPHLTARSSATSPSDDEIPGLSLLLLGLRGTFPSTPFWFREPQLALSIVAVALVAIGAVDRAIG